MKSGYKSSFTEWKYTNSWNTIQTRCMSSNIPRFIDRREKQPAWSQGYVIILIVLTTLLMRRYHWPSMQIALCLLCMPFNNALLTQKFVVPWLVLLSKIVNNMIMMLWTKLRVYIIFDIFIVQVMTEWALFNWHWVIVANEAAESHSVIYMCTYTATFYSKFKFMCFLTFSVVITKLFIACPFIHIM